ncbi:MAG: hypothetical protein Q9208_008814 [Pyrenodesmia sp. 3 TL-2023]
MGVDPLSIVDPARVKIVFLPVGRITHSKFSCFLKRLEQENVVQLRDVSPDSRPHTTTFSPLAYPNGRILFDIRTTLPPASHLALSPFELYRQPLIVVGVADSQNLGLGSGNGDTTADDLGGGGIGSRLSENSTQSLVHQRQHLASEFSSALIHQVLVFDYDGPTQNLPRGIFAVSSPSKSKTTTIKTIMCDLTSQMLAEMASFARYIQDLTSLESPKVPRQDIHRPLARYGDTSRPASSGPSQRFDNTHRPDHRMSMPAHMLANLSSRSSTPEGRPMSPPSGTQTPPTAVNGTSKPASPPSRPADLSRPMSRDRASLQGFGSNSSTERERTKHRGRTSIVMGSLYLMAGRWPDAVKELSDGAAVAKANNDHMWHGKALDYLLVICLLYAWAGLDFRIPPILHAATEKTSSGSSKSSKERPSSIQTDSKSMSVPPSRDSSLQDLSNLLPELLTTIQNLYSRAWTFSEDKLPQLSFSDSGLRFSRLLTIVESSGGKFADANLVRIVLNVPSSQGDVQAAQVTTFPSKAEIATFLFRAFPIPGVDDSLTIADRTRILAGIAWTLGELGYQRKKAHVLKELLEGLIPALVEARKRGAAEMGVHPAASLASLDAAVLGARDTLSQVPYGEDERGIQDFLRMVCRVYDIEMDLETDMRSQREISAAQTAKGNHNVSGTLSNDTVVIIQRAVLRGSNKFFGSVDLKQGILRLCIRICEALPDLEGVLNFSAELLRTSGSGIAPGPEDSHGSPSLSIDDQLRLWTNISRTVSAARQLGLEHLAADYWDDFLLRGIEMVPPASNTPMPHAKDDLESVAKNNADASAGPFLYNPFGQTNPTKASKPLMVAGEEATFRVTLQNLYDFDLEIESIRLGSEEDGYDAPAQSCTIGPYRTQSVFLTATWPESGSGRLSGCMAKVKGCRERWFPVFDQPWSLKISNKAFQSPHPDVQPERPPHVGDLGRKKDARASRGPSPSYLSLDIIPALPSITLKTISLSQSAIMLLEGETKIFSIVLFNNSKAVTADLVLPTFEDSAAAQLQAAMATKELTSSELHELETAASKKSLKWLHHSDESPPVIESRQEATFRIEATGKPGLSDASIQISYGHLGVPRNELKGRFYTRQLSIPLTITVNASIDITGTDLLPFSPSFAWQNQQPQSSQSRPTSATKSSPPMNNRRPSSISSRSKLSKSSNNENGFQALLSRIAVSSNDKSYCLLCLDCQNSWPAPLSISIQVRPSLSSSPTPANPTPTSPKTTDSTTNNSKLTYTVHESLQPGQTKRILLLLPRIRISSAHRPIPSLNPLAKKQFVVTSGPKASYEAQLAARETFWYREELLKQIHATWTEESTQRTGVINTRSISLSQWMVQAYKLPELGVSMSLSVSQPSSSPPPPSSSATDGDERTLLNQLSPTTYSAPVSTFLTLTTTLTNHSPQPIHPLLRLQPRLAGDGHPPHIALDLGRKLLIHGLLQRPLPMLQPGESTGMDVGVVVLGRGRWEVGAVVEEVRVCDDEGHGERGQEDEDDDELVRMRGQRERRVWGGEEKVVIVGR